MKKLFILSTICIITMFFTNNAMSQVVASGTTGACTWELTGTSGNYTLTISGTGAMGNYSGNTPWSSYRNEITTLDLQQGVTTIGDYAFSDCISLTSVLIPNSVTTIGDYAFYYCSSLTSITIPDYVTTIGNYAFYECRDLTSVTIGDSVTTIGNSAFSSCIGLTSVTISNSVTTIGNYAFRYCVGLTSVTIPNSVTTIGSYAFYYCVGLTSVTIPNSVTTIGNYTFYRCSGLISVTIPNSITTIEHAAFYECVGLTSVTIPNSVTSIENSAFYSCSGLTELHVKAQIPPALGDNAFLNVPDTIPVYVCGMINAYWNAPGWNYFNNIIQDCSGIPIVALALPQIYPNPANNELRIKNYRLQERDRIELYNMLGHLQLSIVDAQLSTLNVSHLANGVYMLRIVSDNKVICAEKIVIAR